MIYCGGLWNDVTTCKNCIYYCNEDSRCKSLNQDNSIVNKDKAFCSFIKINDGMK